MILVGFFLLIVVGGMLDTPDYPLYKAVVGSVAALSVFGCGAYLANLYERGRKQ